MPGTLRSRSRSWADMASALSVRSLRSTRRTYTLAYMVPCALPVFSVDSVYFTSGNWRRMPSTSRVLASVACSDEPTGV